MLTRSKCAELQEAYFLSIFSRNSLKIQSGNLHIIPTYYIEFQEPSLNTFQDILLTRFNSDFFQRGITLNKHARQEKKKKKKKKKKNTGQLFFHWEPKYKISKP